jgi:hypothetical protein
MWVGCSSNQLTGNEDSRANFIYKDETSDGFSSCNKGPERFHMHVTDNHIGSVRRIKAHKKKKRYLNFQVMKNVGRVHYGERA